MRVDYEKAMELLDCDGCSYSIATREHTSKPWPIDQAIMLTIPWESAILEFHFHKPRGTDHDCFRYWAHSPHVMKNTLEARGLDEAAIDKFMSTHLYRTGSWGAGSRSRRSRHE